MNTQFPTPSTALAMMISEAALQVVVGISSASRTLRKMITTKG